MRDPFLYQDESISNISRGAGKHGHDGERSPTRYSSSSLDDNSTITKIDNSEY